MQDAQGTGLSLRLLRCHGVAVDAEAVDVPAEGISLGSTAAPGVFYLDAGLYVAPCHADIQQREGVWRLSAHDARAVCVLNGKKMSTPTILTAGDRIELGFAALEVICTDSPFPEALSPQPTNSPKNTLSPDKTSEDTDILQNPGAQKVVSSGFPTLTPTPAEKSPAHSGSAAALVELLRQDFSDNPNSSASDTPFIAPEQLLDSFETASDFTQSDVGQQELLQDQDDDILAQLARESETVLSGIDGHVPRYNELMERTGLLTESSSGKPTFLLDRSGLSDRPDWTISSNLEDPLALLASPDEASLGDLLEGALSIDDILAGLGNEDALLDADLLQPDPLRLLAGTQEEPLRLAGALHQDHHHIGLSTPYRGRSKTTSFRPFRLSRQEDA